MLRGGGTAPAQPHRDRSHEGVTRQPPQRPSQLLPGAGLGGEAGEGTGCHAVPQVEVLVPQSSVGREGGMRLSEGDAASGMHGDGTPRPPASLPQTLKPHLPMALSLLGSKRAGKREQRGGRE